MPLHPSGKHIARLLIVVVAQVALVATVLAAGSPQSDNAGAWPLDSQWRAYTLLNGTPISDIENEAGLGGCTNVNIGSGATGGGATPVRPSIYLAFDGTNAYFRVRLCGNPIDANKGGFDNAFWLVQIATAADNTVRAVVGLNGKEVSTDYVYAANSVGGAVTEIYQTPFDNSGGFDSRGARALVDGFGQYFVDWQVPVSRIQAASGGAITTSTPIKLYFGTSTAANLATINKDYMDTTLGVGAEAVTWDNVASYAMTPTTLSLSRTATLVSGTNPPTESAASEYDIVYTLTNTGGNASNSSAVTLSIPPGTTIVSTSTAKGTVGAVGQDVTWSAGTMQPGVPATATVRVSVTPAPGSAGATITLANAAAATGTDAVTSSAVTANTTAVSVGQVAAPTPSPTPEPTASPTPSPTPQPTASPTPEPTASPTPSPTPEPTASPTPSPTPQPTASPTPEPTASPTPAPTASSTPEPTASPTPEPTASPTPEPTASPTPSPTPEPTASPTPEPTASPTPEPTASPTPEPTASPTPEPTASPTPQPTASPTPEPTASPTPQPTASPTPQPTASPTPQPTASPTPQPTASPTPEPTASPTPAPTASPTPEPTASPTPDPSVSPTPQPTASPTPEPTASPTPEPTASPTPVPTASPTPGATPSASPTPTQAASPSATPAPPPTAAPSPAPTPSGSPATASPEPVAPTELPSPPASAQPTPDDGFIAPAGGTPFDGVATGAMLAALVIAGLMLAGLGRVVWLIFGARRRRFAVVLNGEIISVHRREAHANKAFAKAIAEAKVREQGESAGLLWAVVDGPTPGQRYAVIDRGQRDRRRRPRPGVAARKMIASALRGTRPSQGNPYNRRPED